MFFKRKDSRPTVKKASEFINTKSHEQKKYISLMLVPSYSTGKTRSLRISRAVLYFVVLVSFVIFSVVMGFYLNSRHEQQKAMQLSDTLDETQAAFSTYQYESEQIQGELKDAANQMQEQLTEEQRRAQIEIERQERRLQDTLGDIWDIIDGLEDQIRDFEEERQDIINNLTSHSIIPPVASILSEMEKAHEELRESLVQPVSNEIVSLATVGFLGGVGGRETRGFPNARESLSQEAVIQRLNNLSGELEAQRLMLLSLEEYKEKIQPYLLNYPTIWPVHGRISSPFGWRLNPFGGTSNEFHQGIDIPADIGTPIRAAGGGTVIFSCWQNGYGNVIIINHGNGYTTKYAHNSENIATEGQRVERGDIIARVGSTGRSTGPHLHYEVLRNNTAINPVSFLLELP